MREKKRIIVYGKSVARDLTFKSNDRRNTESRRTGFTPKKAEARRLGSWYLYVYLNNNVYDNMSNYSELATHAGVYAGRNECT